MQTLVVVKLCPQNEAVSEKPALKAKFPAHASINMLVWDLQAVPEHLQNCVLQGMGLLSPRGSTRCCRKWCLYPNPADPGRNKGWNFNLQMESTGGSAVPSVPWRSLNEESRSLWRGCWQVTTKANFMILRIFIYSFSHGHHKLFLLSKCSA